MPAYTERPDSRYDAANLAAIDTSDVARLDAAAATMAYQPREDEALTAEWVAAYERTQDDLMRRVRERRALTAEMERLSRLALEPADPSERPS